MEQTKTAGNDQYKVGLTGVPETLLWPLWNRAGEQEVDSPLIQDPLSSRLVEQIQYDFIGNFGKPNAGHAIRARFIDDGIKGWLEKNPNGTVISLGEGLDSQFWRVDNGTMQWMSVDLAESILIRQALLPCEERIRLVCCSAFDLTWMDEAPLGESVFIALAGLLMFFPEKEVMELLQRIAERFPGSELMFDVIPPWLSSKSLKGWHITKSYTAPPMPWGIRYNEIDKILTAHPAYKVRQQVTYADFWPKRMRPYSYLTKVKYLRDKLAPWMVHLEVQPHFI